VTGSYYFQKYFALPCRNTIQALATFLDMYLTALHAGCFFNKLISPSSSVSVPMCCPKLNKATIGLLLRLPPSAASSSALTNKLITMHQVTLIAHALKGHLLGATLHGVAGFTSRSECKPGSTQISKDEEANSSGQIR